MTLLRRAKSQKARDGEAEASKPLPIPPVEDTTATQECENDTVKKERRTSKFERRRSFFGRSKSADPSRKMPSSNPATISEEAPVAPRTGPAMQKPSHGSEEYKVDPFAMEIISFRAGDATYDFPTPSPRLPPARRDLMSQSSPTVARTPMTAQPLVPYTPRAATSANTPRHAPPHWGRSQTAEMLGRSGSRSRPPPAARAMTQPVTALPEYDDTVVMPEMRKKKSSWKALSGLFHSKKSKADAEASTSDRSQAPSFEPPQARQMQSGQRPERKLEDDEADLSRPQVASVPSQTSVSHLETPSPSWAGGVRSPHSSTSAHSRTSSVPRGMARFEARAEADRAAPLPQVDEGAKRMRSASDTAHPRGPINHTTRGGKLSPIRGSYCEPARDSVALFNQVSQEDARHDSPMRASGAPAHSRPGAPRTPKLDLDIPDGGMERYSVMFEKLLEPRQSILERRKSKARRQSSVLKDLPAIPSPGSATQSPIDGKLALASGNKSVPSGPSNYGRMQRSVTSPHMLQTPTNLTINPQNPPRRGEVQTAIHRPRPIQRSKTVPPKAVSPVAPNFSRPVSRRVPTAATGMPCSAPDDADCPSPTSLLGAENSLPLTPTETFAAVTDTEPLPISSYNSAKLPISRHHRLPHAPQDSVDAQQWDMLTSRPIDSTSPTGRQPYPRIKSPEDLERQIVQVSVARQVSVSKARRKVENAVTTKQPMRPRVVELGTGKDAMKRPKSTHVVVIGADGELDGEDVPDMLDMPAR